MSITPLPESAVSKSGAPKTKSARRERIAELIGSQVIHSQAQLSALLEAEGFIVAQATLSRDLDDLGAIKIRDRGGALAYSLPDGDAHGDLAAHRLEERIAEFLLSVDRSGDLVMLRTPPGGAQLLAASFDRFAAVAAPTRIIGTVAGDDTILLVAREGQGAYVLATVREIAEGERTSQALRSVSNGNRGEAL